MRKVLTYLIATLLLISCDKDTVIEQEEIYCNCYTVERIVYDPGFFNDKEPRVIVGVPRKVDCVEQTPWTTYELVYDSRYNAFMHKQTRNFCE